MAGRGQPSHAYRAARERPLTTHSGRTRFAVGLGVRSYDKLLVCRCLERIPATRTSVLVDLAWWLCSGRIADFGPIYYSYVRGRVSYHLCCMDC